MIGTSEETLLWQWNTQNAEKPIKLEGRLMTVSDNRRFFVTGAADVQGFFVYRSWNALTPDPSIADALPVFQEAAQELVKVSPNGRWLWTSKKSAEDIFNTTQLWDLNRDAVITLAIDTAGRDLSEEKEWKKYLGKQTYKRTRDTMSTLTRSLASPGRP